jgi:hypothetical protein
MRFLFFLILLAGLGLGVGYPWYVNNFSGQELGTYRVFERGTGFKPVQVRLEAADAPVRVLVDLTSLGSPRFSADRTVLTLTAATAGRTVLADTLTFAQSQARDAAPQMQDRIFRSDARPMTDISDGAYTFTIGQGDADGIDIRAVDLILRGGALVVDPRAQPIGLSLIAIGVIGLVLALRRRRTITQANPNSQPPPPRWGRGGER